MQGWREGGRKVRGTAAEWESCMEKGGRRHGSERKLEEAGWGEVSPFLC